MRYKIFKQNLKYIEETNAKNLSFILGIGPFTDLTKEEFKEKYLMKTQDVMKMMAETSESPYPVKSQGSIDFKLGQTKYNLG